MDLAKKALDKLNELLDCGDVKTELAVVKEILDLPAEISGVNKARDSCEDTDGFLSLMKELKNEKSNVYQKTN